MTYSVDPFSIRFTETRRGINATAAIVSNGRKIGTIHDAAEQIVSDVSFVAEQERITFIAEARQALTTVFGKANASDGAFISEYARGLLQEAEKRLLSSTLVDCCPKPSM